MKGKYPIIYSVSSMEDINKLKELDSVKYINLDITNPNLEVIKYLIDNGGSYSYSDMIDGVNGYIYVSYDVFKKGQLFILDLINRIDTSYNKLEIARYLYISIGKNIGYDINVIPDKNETFNLNTISTINNIWGCVCNKKGTNISLTKLYLYLCRLASIDCSIVSINKIGYLKNKVDTDKSSIIVDITQDVPYIQGGFKTKYFIGYNDNISIDKKINYIKDDYSDNKLDDLFKDIDYNKENFFLDILVTTQDIVGASQVKPIELGIIYDIIFSKFCPNYDISINNLYINGSSDKEHFIVISYDDRFYSYNYNRNSFMEINYSDIKKNIDSHKIGIYLNEEMPLISSRLRKAS